MRIVSLNVGMPREVEMKRGPVATGIYKEPVQGRVMARKLNLDGDSKEVIQHYLNLFNKTTAQNSDLTQIPSKEGIGNVFFSGIRFREKHILQEKPIIFELELKSDKPLGVDEIDIAVSVQDKFGVNLIHMCNRFINKPLGLSGAQNTYEFTLNHSLRPGNYSLTLFIRINGIIEDWKTNALSGSYLPTLLFLLTGLDSLLFCAIAFLVVVHHLNTS